MIGVPREQARGEKCVALVPASVPQLAKAGLEVLVESGAGVAAGYPDAAYVEKGASIAASRAQVFEKADIVLQVKSAAWKGERGGEPEALRPNCVLAGFMDPLNHPEGVKAIAATGATCFAMELMPRISRAQSMDALSSMGTIIGYKSVLLAADRSARMFPMLMTAAGTVTPARVFVIGAGVAGLMAIATAKRLGAVVEAYDVRPAVREQVESLGGKFFEIPVDTKDAQDAGGYAKQLDDSVYKRQQELLAPAIVQSDVVITTAVIPGKKPPLLITKETVARMKPGSIIVDTAAEWGGNCELTRAGETVDAEGVILMGPINIPSLVAYHASHLYARNLTTFLLHLAKDKTVNLNTDDEIIRETLVARGGAVTHPRIKALLDAR